MNKMTDYQDRIVRIHGFVGGKPVVKGTRIPVELVLKYLAYDPNLQTLFETFPQLTLDDHEAGKEFERKALRA